MKKIVLIHLILSFFLSNYSFCQDQEHFEIERHNVSSYLGVSPGFEIYKEDSAYVTVAAPIGLNFRIYNSFNLLTFVDLDLAFLPIVIEQNKFTSYLKIGIGFGYSGESYNQELHLNYSHSFLGYSNMVGIGYDLEAISIPLSIEVLYPMPLSNKYRFYLIGFKIPITNVNF